MNKPTVLDSNIEEAVGKIVGLCEVECGLCDERKQILRELVEDVVNDVIPEQQDPEKDEGDTGWNDAVVSTKVNARSLGLNIQ